MHAYTQSFSLSPGWSNSFSPQRNLSMTGTRFFIKGKLYFSHANQNNFVF